MASAGGISTAGYTHDALDNLVVVKQGTLYTYDDNGNLLSHQDARGAARPEFQVAAGMTKAYDGLGRPRRRRTREGAVEKDGVWKWDPAIGNGKGRLGSVSYGTTTVSYTGYDSLGRVTGHKQTTDGVDYSFTDSYFRSDEAKTIGCPGGDPNA